MKRKLSLKKEFGLQYKSRYLDSMLGLIIKKLYKGRFLSETLISSSSFMGKMGVGIGNSNTLSHTTEMEKRITIGGSAGCQITTFQKLFTTLDSLPIGDGKWISAMKNMLVVRRFMQLNTLKTTDNSEIKSLKSMYSANRKHQPL